MLLRERRVHDQLPWASTTFKTEVLRSGGVNSPPPNNNRSRPLATMADLVHAHDDVEGCAHLVRHGGQELRLGVVGCLRLSTGGSNTAEKRPRHEE